MRLTDFLDKGASLGAEAPCLTTGGRTLTYGDVQTLSWQIARALDWSGIRPGDKVAILSANDPVAFSCVFGISRAGAVWCPVNPRNEAAENRDLLDFFDCKCLIFQAAFAPLVTKILPDLPKLTTLVCLDGEHRSATPFRRWLADLPAEPWQAEPPDDIVMLVGTGGTTGRPKGVMLTGHNIETMSALTLMSYPFRPRPRYLALAPLTHAAGVLCFPVMTLGGEIVIMPAPDLAEFLALVEKNKITHTFLPPTLIYMLLDHDRLAETDTTHLQCLWYGAAPMSASRLEEALARIGPVLGQLFGQSEAPMMISALAPADHFRDDGSLAAERLSCAGRPTPLTTVAIMDDEGNLLGPGQRGEIVVRGPLVMAGYYKNPQASAEAARHGWHHTGDIGYLDEDGYLFIVDRAKDMIITGGFNVYSAEVEQVLLAHPAVQDCAVIGLPDEKWGERVTAVVQLRPGQSVTGAEVRSFVKERLGSVKAPKRVEVWPDLPRSKVGKVLKVDIKARFRDQAASPHPPGHLCRTRLVRASFGRKLKTAETGHWTVSSQTVSPPGAPSVAALAAAAVECLAQLNRDRPPAALVVVHFLGRELSVLDGHQRLIRAVVLQDHGDLALHRRICPIRATPGEPEPPGPVQLDELAGHVQREPAVLDVDAKRPADRRLQHDFDRPGRPRAHPLGHAHRIEPLVEHDVRGSGQHPPHHCDSGPAHRWRFRRSSLAASASARSDQNDTCSAIHSSAGSSPAERTVSQ